MTFTRLTDITRDGIEDWTLTFFVPGPSNPETTSTGLLSVQILKSDGSIEVLRDIDVLDRLNDDVEGQGYLADLVNLRNYITTRLNNELLPL